MDLIAVESVFYILNKIPDAGDDWEKRALPYIWEAVSF
jgi:hypothetical protein